MPLDLFYRLGGTRLLGPVVCRSNLIIFFPFYDLFLTIFHLLATSGTADMQTGGALLFAYFSSSSGDSTHSKKKVIERCEGRRR